MKERVTVQVADDHLDRTEDVARQLRAAGMEVDQVLGNVGIITGSIDSERRADLGEVPGVAGVESERTFQVAPPDSDVQ